MKKAMMLAVVLGMCVAPMAAKASDGLSYDMVVGLSYATEGGVLPNAAAYKWWYGCSPTSAGMAMAYYDLNGYGGLSYSNLVAGGVAETTTFPSTAGAWTYLAQYAIASEGHVVDFYSTGYKGSGDDAYAGRAFDCLADFMGTSQDSAGNSNGGTNFYFRKSGKALTYDQIEGLGSSYYESDGMYGIGEYITYCGYSFTDLYTQLTDNNYYEYEGFLGGFAFEDYMDEIDAGRVVLLHVKDHTMIGVGYGDDYTVYLYDTWANDQNSMTWGGSYSDLTMWGVTVLELAGGDVMVPVPGAILLVTFGTGCVNWLRRRRILLS